MAKVSATSALDSSANKSPSPSLCLAISLRCCKCWRAPVPKLAPMPPLEATPVIPTDPTERCSSSSCSSSQDKAVTEGKRHSKVSFPDGSTYDGQFLDGKRHGQGTLTLADGTRYVAEWRNDTRHGEGAEYCMDGTCFTGTYAHGFRTGHGVMTWPEGSKYSGQFSRDKANGEGNLLRTDGSVYKGTFVDDCMCGKGCMQWKDGVEYVGQFVCNRRAGQGKMKWTTGKWKSYDGGWKDGQQHGAGTLVDQHDQEHKGIFQWGKLLQWLEDEQAKQDDPLPEGSLEVPSYWTNQNLSLSFSERNEVSEDFQQQIQRLLDGTFKAVRTRDRSGRVPSRLRLVKSHRVENLDMWIRYLKAKARIAAKRPEGVPKVNELNGTPEIGFVRTQELLDSVTCDKLDSKLNEFYLWHGSTPEGAIGISENGFKMSYAGSHAGTYFGRGCYFAECSSKSDEYAQAGDKLLSGVYALLLCRVTCGSLFRITVPDNQAIDKALSSGDYDSVLGDREASVGTYREFVVHDENLIYPEYVVLYERKFEA